VDVVRALRMSGLLRLGVTVVSAQEKNRFLHQITNRAWIVRLINTRLSVVGLVSVSREAHRKGISL
jgi:hypothetical protein